MTVAKKLPWKQIWETTYRQFREIWKNPAVFPILGLQILLAGMTVWNGVFVEQSTTSKQPLPMHLLISLFAVFFVIYYVLSLTQTLFIVSFLQNPGRPLAHARRQLKQLLRSLIMENSRSMAISTLWMLLLIVPGVIKMVRFYFVSYVVLDDPAYDRGEIDCLERSTHLTRGIAWPLTGVIILSLLSGWIVEYLLPLLFNQLLPRSVVDFIFYLLSLPVSVLFTAWTFQIYRTRVSS